MIIRGDLIPSSKTNSSHLGHWGWFRYVQISFLLGLGLLTGFGKGKNFRCELFVFGGGWVHMIGSMAAGAAELAGCLDATRSASLATTGVATTWDSLSSGTLEMMVMMMMMLVLVLVSSWCLPLEGFWMFRDWWLPWPTPITWVRWAVAPLPNGWRCCFERSSCGVCAMPRLLVVLQWPWQPLHLGSWMSYIGQGGANMDEDSRAWVQKNPSFVNY